MSLIWQAMVMEPFGWPRFTLQAILRKVVFQNGLSQRTKIPLPTLVNDFGWHKKLVESPSTPLLMTCMLFNEPGMSTHTTSISGRSAVAIPILPYRHGALEPFPVVAEVVPSAVI